MALSAQSLFLYGYTVTVSNQYIDFKGASGGPEITATLPLGDYSLSSLGSALQAAMQAADPTNVYIVTVDRSLLGGLANRITISSSGSFFQILFGTGTHAVASMASLVGFNPTDYTGGTSYTGSQSTGTSLVPVMLGYDYADPNQQQKRFGAVNVSASGLKEAVFFNTQDFIDVEFMYEPKSKLPAWLALMTWMTAQKPFDFTPEITKPSIFFPVTLEKSEYEGRGLGFQMKEMLKDYPNFYTTQPMNFRVVKDFSTTTFIL